MSLSTRAIAAIGAVVVIGAATVGASVAVASGEPVPSDHTATLVVGNSSTVEQPFCFNGGKPLTEEQQTDCRTRAGEAMKAGKLPSSDVVASDRIAVGVSPAVAERTWWANTNGGSATGTGSFVLAPSQTGNTFSGSVGASRALHASGKTVVTVVESGPKESEDIYAVWYFQLNTQDS
ncbi:hypothetical protein ACWEQL_15845 [Kitasatospora sp. NPDC004240]